jgi:hypothetical protein
MHVHGSLWLALLLIPARGTGIDVSSGPPVGERVAALKVFDATGAYKEKEVDYAAERKEKSTAYVFIAEWNRPVARFLKKLDGGIKEASEESYLVAVWLTEDPEKMKEYLPRVQESIKLENTAMTVFPGNKNGPEGWGINDRAHVTVVIANKGKVAASLGYVSINETDVPKVQEVLKKSLEKEE